MRYLTVFLIIFCFLGVGSAQAREEITISFVGDVNPQLLMGVSRSELEDIKRAFGDSDIVFGNLESPLTTYGKMTAGKNPESIKARKDYVFRSDPASVEKLFYLGFHVFSLANNHMMDYSTPGLKDTLSALWSKGIFHCGAGVRKDAYAPVYLTRKNVKIAFIAISEIVPRLAIATETEMGIAGMSYPAQEYELEMIENSIGEARRKGAEIVVVSLHWGKEGCNKIEDYQRVLAKRLLDSGADCIIGHHPHVLRPVELYRGRVIAYSLGNFIFSSSSDRSTMVLGITFSRGTDKIWRQSLSRKYMKIRNGIPRK